MTQLLPLLYVGGSRDLLFGFNQTDAGLATLLLLMVTVPLVNLAWLVMEIRHAVKSLRERKGWLVLLGPSLALLLLAEALAVDYYILTQVRM